MRPKSAVKDNPFDDLAYLLREDEDIKDLIEEKLPSPPA
jgi:hypothetical protein